MSKFAYLTAGTLFGLVLAFILHTWGGVSGGSFRDGRTVVRVSSLVPGGKYGHDELQPGDRIEKINGIRVDSTEQAYRVLQALCMGPTDTISVSVARKDDDGKAVKLDGPVKLSRDNVRSIVLFGMGHKRVDCSTYETTSDGLFDVASEGNVSAVHDMLESGAKKYIDDLTDDQTPLLAAVAGGHVSVVRELLDHKADVNKPGSDGTTPLMKAAAMGNEQVVAMLLAAGADPTMRNSALKTASEIADAQGFLEVSQYIDNPSPTKFLNADQKRKVVESLAKMGDLKTESYRASDAEIGTAIKSYQKRFGLPETGVLTDYNFSDLLKDAKKDIETKNEDQIDETTQKTLSRVFSRSLMERWTPVSGATGYPDCNKETVLFQISPDQQVITWASFRPGVSLSDLSSGAKPTQTSSFKVVRASQIEGYDTLVVRPDPKPVDGPALQTWEVRDGVIKITLKAHDDRDDRDDGFTSKNKDSGLAQDLQASATDAQPGSFLAQCH